MIESYHTIAMLGNVRVVLESCGGSRARLGHHVRVTFVDISTSVQRLN